MSMTEVEIEPESAKDPEQKNAIAAFVQKYSSLVVTNPEEYQDAGGLLARIKAEIKARLEYWKPAKKKLDEAHAEICKKEKDSIAPLKELEKTVGEKMSLWSQAEERKRRDEEVRLQADARKKAADDAKRQADLLKKSGRPEEAKAVIQQAAVPVQVVVQSSVPKVAGLSERKSWKFRIVDPSKLQRQFLKPDEVAIGALVRSLGKSSEQVLGAGAVETWEESSFAGRGS